MTVLSLRHAGLSLSGRSVVADASLDCRTGEMVGLLGPNGAGKSSLLRLAAGLWRPERGTVRWDDVDLSATRASWRARRIAFMPQENGVPPSMSVRDLVSLGRLPFGETGMNALRHPAVTAALAATHLDVLADRSAAQLSGGERARLHLARALAVDTPALLVDEPIAALDPEHALSVMALLRDWAHRGRAVLVVIHDLGLAARYCDRLALMRDGQVIAAGVPNEVLTDDAIGEVYGVTVRRLDGVPVPWTISR
ncbi:ferrichrome ABC transporter ATP-binding protein [Neoasaia chiangmaiensis NBRC 101099]|uniref:Ferrichrome ABC transporter ATP-binding protein n=1 Tax=Neoasaia chiangmaiensis TaxID=320497 RepID=A0A1U9KNH2_9PROT|nr:ABC transporter ATP-binding protein [Neoasaia chiangmaiensis]AQS87303.1 ferrichrome ABC transporter ATP-binding protein [Neoasaia chiangmaiensis]GBR38609.1 ferrichrome ABC transporter ATP-binding protein [Neoasaia chiangmaiensis NBRC 101099]GEN15819.1 ABC transporter [Neoasaia chiangmaiensis]